MDASQVQGHKYELEVGGEEEGEEEEQDEESLVSNQAQDESLEFDYILNTIIPNLTFQNIRPSALCINTMTVVCKPSANTVRFSIPVVKQILLKRQECEELEEGMTISTKGLGKNCIIFKWIQKLEDIDDKKKTRNISIKMFGNGSIHIVGVTRPIDALLISNYFLNFFNDIQRSTDSIDPSISSIDSSIDPTCLTGETETYSICMIQSNFEVDYAIRFKEFREHWDVSGGDIIYNKESRHPGLHIKFGESSTSCIIFASGKILITGAKKPEHLEVVYKSVTDFIDRKKDFITQEKIVPEKKIPQKRGRKRKAEHDAFYDNFDVNIEL